MDTNKKKIIIISIYSLIFLVITSFIYIGVRQEPTCFDGKKNQSEKGVDCGGVCTPCEYIGQTQDLMVTEKAVVFGGNNTYDFIAKIKNPNPTVGAEKFSFEAIMLDDQKNIIAQKEADAYILPGDTRYIAVVGMTVDEGKTPTVADIKIKEVKWKELMEYGKPQLSIFGKKYSKLIAGVGGQVEGVLRNESPYDLKTIDVVSVLRSEDSKIIAINTTQKEQMKSDEEREFKMTWPYSFAKEVAKIEVDAQANMFQTDILMTDFKKR